MSNSLIDEAESDKATPLSPSTATLTPHCSADTNFVPKRDGTEIGLVNVADGTDLDTMRQPYPPVQESSGPVPSGESAPTDSHALAAADHDEKGIAQLHSQYNTEAEVKDLGWNERPEKIPSPLVGGLPNEELWMLVRRFNKQMYHVKAIEHHPPGGLDLNVAPENEFSPDRLRSNIERLYMTVIVGMTGFVKHIARLRSWAETERTAAFCAVIAFFGCSIYPCTDYTDI
jgi:hypothetical protein